MVKVKTIAYDEKKYPVADIPDVIFGRDSRLLIGSYSLSIALYDDEKGYPDRTAEGIDEKIYAYLDDQYFSLEDNDFLSKVKELLD